MPRLMCDCGVRAERRGLKEVDGRSDAKGHHFRKRHGDRWPRPASPQTLCAGFQAAGTRGAAMIAGAQSVKIHGELIPIRAEVQNLDMLSAHADADELLRWLRGFKAPPRLTYIVHGEPAAS